MNAQTESKNEWPQEILAFLKDHHHATVGDIAGHVLSDTSPKAMLALRRELTALYQKKYVGRQRLTAHLGASSPYVYSLRARGARMVGLQKVPSQFYRIQKGIWHEFEEAKLKLEHMAESRNWTIFEGDEVCRAVLLYYSLYLDSLRRGTRMEEEVERANPHYAFSLPAKIRPDLILATDYDLIVVIIAHPRSYGKFLKKRLADYENIIGMAKIVVITFTHEQMKNCQRVFDSRSDAYQKYHERVLIIGTDNIDELPEIIRETSLRFVQYESNRRILTDWNKKEGRQPHQKFILPTS